MQKRYPGRGKKKNKSLRNVKKLLTKRKKGIIIMIVAFYVNQKAEVDSNDSGYAPYAERRG